MILFVICLTLPSSSVFRKALKERGVIKTISVSIKMTEIHLELCIQSTQHLLETVSNVKENIRILEVFLNSGLTNAGYINGEYAPSDGKGAFTGSHHLNCCCMCRFRQVDEDRGNFNLNGITSRASAATVSLSSNPSSLKKSRPAPAMMPRLNRTASLRRETVLQRQKAQDAQSYFYKSKY